MATLGQRMVGAMRADAATFEEIEHDANAMGQAVMVIIIAGVAAMIGNIFRHGISAGIFSLIVMLIGYGVWTVLVTLIGTKLMPEPQTKADFAETFRTVAFAASPGIFNVIMIIPFLGPLLGILINIWCLVIMVVAVRVVLDYTSVGRAIVVVLIGFIIYWILAFMILMPLFIGSALLG